jgi:DNA-binding transcriptional LysR family regulator
VIELSDWDLLRTFLIFSEHLDHATAATRLGISGRTLSRRLTRLEHELGVVLIVRTGSRTALTPTGAWLRDGITAPLDDIRARLVGARSSARAPALAIAISTDLPPDWVTRTNDWLARRGEPAVLRLEASDEALRLLRTGELQLALVAGEPDGERRAVVGHEPLVVVFPDHHPAADQRTIEPGDLLGLPVAVPEAADERRRRAAVARVHGDPDLPYVVAPSVGTAGRGLIHAARTRGAVAIALEHIAAQTNTAGLAVIGLGPEHAAAVTLIGRAEVPEEVFRTLADRLLGTPA